MNIYLDILCRTGRILGTTRSLYDQVNKLLDLIDNCTGIQEVLDEGLDL